jgi:hypothetical protein
MTLQELNQLSPVEKRRLIAEADGWVLDVECVTDDEEHSVGWRKPGVTQGPCGTSMLPDYLHSLTRIATARRSIFAERPSYYDRAFVSNLRDVLGGNDGNGMLDLREAYYLISSTAEQQADALLLTVIP